MKRQRSSDLTENIKYHTHKKKEKKTSSHFFFPGEFSLLSFSYLVPTIYLFFFTRDDCGIAQEGRSFNNSFYPRALLAPLGHPDGENGRQKTVFVCGSPRPLFPTLAHSIV